MRYAAEGDCYYINYNQMMMLVGSAFVTFDVHSNDGRRVCWCCDCNVVGAESELGDLKAKKNGDVTSKMPLKSVLERL